MSKSQVETFISLYAALSRDIVAYDPTLAVDMERDNKRIISNGNYRGLSFFLKDLPEIAKILESSLSSGRLARHDLPLMGGHKHGSPIPRLFKGLWLRLFTIDGCLRQDIDPTFVLFLEQLCCLGKKYEVDPPASSLYETTKEFYDVDVALPPSSKDWSLGSCAFDPDYNISIIQRFTEPSDQYDLFGTGNSADAKLLDTIQRCADTVSGHIGEVIIPNVSSRHGKGAVYEGLRGYEKYSRDLIWPTRLRGSFLPDGFLHPLGSDTCKDTGDQPSKLLAVPKTIKGPRLIAKEPTAHMYAQLSIMDWIYDRVRNSVLSASIDFLDQTKNGNLALSSSLSGSHATIDLKSASDRISLWLIERLFRRNISLLRLMADSRTQYVDLSIDKKLPSLHKLRKFTTQGSALTFPIQSIVFFMICVGAILHQDGLYPTIKNISRVAKTMRVFGDDIIVPNDRVGVVVAALEMLYLKVNTQKTHSSGYFRESCGVRAYKGVDVTPAYVPATITRRSKTTEFARAIEVSNNFSKKWLFNLSVALTSSIPSWFLNKINYGVDSAGSIVLHSFSGSKLGSAVKVKYNDRYQREEAWSFAKRAKRNKLKHNGSLLLDAYLASRDREPPVPSFEGILDWYSPSRWETKDVVSLVGVPYLP